MIIFSISFTHNAYAKMPAQVITGAYDVYFAENRVLFYIGKHKHSDKIAIWGQTALTEDMVRILLESPRDVVEMEALLRSTGKRWAGNYRNYSLYNFLLSEPEQTDNIFIEAVIDSSELRLLNAYVDSVEEGDGATKFFDRNGDEVLPVKKIRGGVTECAMAEGDACSRLYQSYFDYSVNLARNQLTITEENMQRLRGRGIYIKEIVEKLGFESGSALGRARSTLKEELPEDHFIHRMELYKHGNSWARTRKSYYRIDSTATP